MKCVELNAIVNNISGVISALAYLQLLPQFAPTLPAESASMPEHAETV
jgi:hypothetical protein